MHKEVQFAQLVVVGQCLSELAKRSLEVVVLHRHVVVVGCYCALHLVQPCQSFRVCSSVIHIVSEKVGAAAKFHQSHGIGILRIDVRAAVVGLHHASAKLASEIRILLVALVELFFLLAKLFGGNGCGGSERLEIESFEVVARRFLYRPFPESVGIVAIERQHLAEWHWLGEFRPAGAGVERKVETYALGNAFQCH